MKTAIEVSEWVANSLMETIDETLALRASRLYGVHDWESGPVKVLLDTNPDPYALFDAEVSSGYDHYSFVMTGLKHPLDPETEEPVGEPVRVRLVATVNDETASVFVETFDSIGRTTDAFEEAGEGAFPMALKAWHVFLKNGLGGLV